jgi:hypothetical protein
VNVKESRPSYHNGFLRVTSRNSTTSLNVRVLPSTERCHDSNSQSCRFSSHILGCRIPMEWNLHRRTTLAPGPSQVKFA